MRNRKFKLINSVVTAAMLAGTLSSLSVSAAPENGWEEVDGKYYWYEEGVRQGYDPNDPAYRGKEIFDPDSRAWYWLDNVQQGAKAVSKDVYQESKAGQWAADFVEGDWDASTGKWVRYDADGHMIKGWSEDHQYYFDEIYGTMARGYVTIDGQEYCFNEVTGIKERDLGAVPEGNGWKTIDGVEYWYENGIRQGYSVDASYRGKEIYDSESNAWYWLDNVDYGKKAVSKDVYQESDAGPWAANADGTGKWVRYDAEGCLVTGWDTNENGTYYFDPFYGTMARGTVTIDGLKYTFDEKTGVLKGSPSNNGGNSGIDNLSWEITTEGKLIVTGNMEGLPEWGWDEWGRWWSWENAPWTDRKDEIISAYMDFTGAESLSDLFCDYSNLQSVDLSSLDTGGVTDMGCMFLNCRSLTSVDLSNLDTSSVTDMNSMFYACSNLTSVNLSGLDTSSVTDMSYMFSRCYNLTSVDLSGLDTSSVTSMDGMFWYCYDLISVDLRSFDTSHVTDMSYMFSCCYDLTSVDLSGLDTSSVTNMYMMFYNCGSLTSLDLSSFDTRSVTDMSHMFRECSNLKKILVGSEWKTAERSDYMFDNCGTDQVTVKQ